MKYQMHRVTKDEMDRLKQEAPGLIGVPTHYCLESLEVWPAPDDGVRVEYSARAVR